MPHNTKVIAIIITYIQLFLLLQCSCSGFPLPTCQPISEETRRGRKHSPQNTTTTHPSPLPNSKWLPTPVNKELLVPPLCSVIFRRLHSHLGMSQEPVGNSLVNWVEKTTIWRAAGWEHIFFRAFLFLGPSGILRSPAASALFTALLTG